MKIVIARLSNEYSIDALKVFGRMRKVMNDRGSR